MPSKSRRLFLSRLASGGTPDAVDDATTATLIDRSRPVPEGIVAINRVQEHGCSTTGS